jgi:hypothetical protein
VARAKVSALTGTALPAMAETLARWENLHRQCHGIVLAASCDRRTGTTKRQKITAGTDAASSLLRSVPKVPLRREAHGICSGLASTIARLRRLRLLLITVIVRAAEMYEQCEQRG